MYTLHSIYYKISVLIYTIAYKYTFDTVGRQLVERLPLHKRLYLYSV